MELQDGREYSRGEMYPISHQKKDRSFVNEEARQINEQLEREIYDASSEAEAYLRVFGKDHPGYVRGMGLGVTPTQVKSTQFVRSMSSLESDANIQKMQVKIDTLKAQVSQVDFLKEQLLSLCKIQGEIR